MQAVKWAVAKLEGDKTAFFLQGNEWPRSCRETNQHLSLPWNFITHGFLDPSAFPEDLSIGKEDLGQNSVILARQKHCSLS